MDMPTFRNAALIGVIAASMLFGTCFSLSSASAAEKVKLPATAKKLDKAGIIAAYGGKTTNFTHPNTDNVFGLAIFDAEMAKGHGTFVAGKTKGEWETKITLKDDQYCWSLKVKGKKKYEKPVCNLVYLDGNTAYEVHPKNNAILSVNVIQ
jgi:hypothetical protein